MVGLRRIFYDLQSGEIIQEIGREVFYVIPTIEQDISAYKALFERNRDTFDVLELPFGEYAQDFVESNGYRVNVETKTLEFNYPDPNEPEAPPVYEKALSTQIKELETKTDQAVMELTMVIAMGGMA